LEGLKPAVKVVYHDERHLLDLADFDHTIWEQLAIECQSIGIHVVPYSIDYADTFRVKLGQI
jgi:hypothetical protein